MAATATIGFPIPATTPAATIKLPSARRRRRISPSAGRALEILGHAVEYLADEFVHEGADFRASNPQVEAIQLLMAVNRRVYFECPQLPTFGERCRALLGHLAT